MILKKLTKAILILLILFSPKPAYAYKSPTINNDKTLIHNSSYFKVQEGTINLIVNSIYEDSSNLYLDAYIFNCTNTTINSICNYNLSMFDKNNTLIFSKEFSSIPLETSLDKFEGQRVTLPIDKSLCNLKDKDLSNLIWKYSYKYQ